MAALNDHANDVDPTWSCQALRDQAPDSPLARRSSRLEKVAQEPPSQFQQLRRTRWCAVPTAIKRYMFKDSNNTWTPYLDLQVTTPSPAPAPPDHRLCQGGLIPFGNVHSWIWPCCLIVLRQKDTWTTEKVSNNTMNPLFNPWYWPCKQKLRQEVYGMQKEKDLRRLLKVACARFSMHVHPISLFPGSRTSQLTAQENKWYNATKSTWHVQWLIKTRPIQSTLPAWYGNWLNGKICSTRRQSHPPRPWRAQYPFFFDSWFTAHSPTNSFKLSSTFINYRRNIETNTRSWSHRRESDTRTRQRRIQTRRLARRAQAAEETWSEWSLPTRNMHPKIK